MSLLRRFRGSRSGNIAILTGITLPMLIGFCGLGGDMGYWYYRQRVIQAAADIAAFNGAVALRAGDSSSRVVAVAKQAAIDNGWKSGSGTITINTPPTSGSYENDRSVEVKIEETEPRFFTSLFSSKSVDEDTRAVATYTFESNACMLALNKNAPGAMTFWGNAWANFSGCNAVSNSLADDAFKIGGSGTVTSPCISSAGGAILSGTLNLTDCKTPMLHAPQANDPYASLPAPPIPSTCQPSQTSGSFSPGLYCGGMSINGAANFAPGVYVVSGGTLKINAGAIASGSDVTFYLTNGATLSFNGNATINLDAPTSGTYSGVLFYGDRTQPSANNTLNGNASSNMTGAVYFPSQEVKFLGNFSGQNGCMQVVAATIYYTGSATFHADCTSSGMGAIKVPGAVTLVE
jgi:hypothetical protein